MTEAITVPLSRPIKLVNGEIRSLTIRSPGRKIVDAMIAARVRGGFTDAAATRFLARLCGHSEPTITHLSPDDFAAALAGLERLFADGRRRLEAGRAAAEEGQR